VLFFETSEELPPALEVYRMLRCVGERGLLGRAQAVLMGRPKAWSIDQRLDLPDRERFADEQRDAVLRVLAEYAPEAVVVLDVDFGHTDPQLIIPCGGEVTVDGAARRVVVRY
jgi:muramoyltetrapeptide carboxypeptidase LdcA involved in peptidoglycan recycling